MQPHLSLTDFACRLSSNGKLHWEVQLLLLVLLLGHGRLGVQSL